MAKVKLSKCSKLEAEIGHLFFHLLRHAGANDRHIVGPLDDSRSDILRLPGTQH